MSLDRYACCDERRRAELTAPGSPPDVSGIDYIEVDAGATTLDPTVIDVVLVKPLGLPLANVGAASFRLEGGVRYRPPTIDPNVQVLPGGATVEHYVLTIPAGELTDFSTYRLSFVDSASSDSPPSFIDPRLASVEFSFKIACQTDFDCAPCEDEVDELPQDPEFDYRVRDYPGFRRQLLDRLSELLPGFREDDPVDLTTTLVEALAYRADQQSYRLDWVGTEAFLATARSRTSLARHARLADYPIGEGASARVFARFDLTPGAIADGVTLEGSTPLLVRIEGLPPVIPADQYAGVLATRPIVFETVAAVRLWAWRNHIELYTWRDDECRLLRGATAATVVDGSLGAGPLEAGDLLLFAETRSPETGDAADARHDRRHVVRLTRVTPTSDVLDSTAAPGQAKPLLTVEWAAQDALPFDLVIQARLQDALGASSTVICAEAAGNLMLADHGASAPPPPMLGLAAEADALRPRLVPALPPEDEPWRPVLDRTDLARLDPARFDAVPRASAAELATVVDGRCLPALWLQDDFGQWTSRRDLLESGRFTRDFVVETTIDGRAALRFGDGINGLAPAPGAPIAALGRFGSGPVGNIGASALAHVVVPAALQAAQLRVTNPLPGRGGAAPEAAASIRISAPEAFRRQDRAVTVADYAEAAKRHAEVANAVAIARWTGAWQTVLVYVDRRGGLAVDEPFKRDVARHLEHYRLMGFDTAVGEAKSAPLDIELDICAAPGEFRSSVGERVRTALRPLGDGAGIPGFFHPDNFTFGSPLYLSRLIQAVMGIEGVQSAEAARFQRLDRLPQGELDAGVIRPGEFEVLRLDDDPSFPERGRLVVSVAGGR